MHSLSITFDPTIATGGRFMACSGGWDWAPYSRAGDDRQSPVFTFGFFKPIYIVEVKEVLIVNVVPKIYYLGPYPTDPILNNRLQGDFRLVVDVHLDTTSGTLEPGTIITFRAPFFLSDKKVPI